MFGILVLYAVQRRYLFFTLGTRFAQFIGLSVLAALLTAADATELQTSHLLVVSFDDDACQSGLSKSVQDRPQQAQFARAAWHEFYHLSSAPPGPSTWTSTWEETQHLWSSGEFEAALQRSSSFLATVHSKAQLLTLPEATQALVPLTQLRITLLMLEDREDAAEQESDLLLSRHAATYYCEKTEFPEACALLRQREAETPLFWKPTSAHLAELQRFAVQADRTLSVISQPTPTTIRWELPQEGAQTLSLVTTGDCRDSDFWQRSLTDWDAYLSQQTSSFLEPPPPSRSGLRGTAVATSTLASALLVTAAISSARFSQRSSHFHSCLESSRDCPTDAALQRAHRQFRSSKRQTIALWSTTAILGGASIPLHRSAKRNEQRRSSSGTTHQETTTSGNSDESFLRPTTDE